MPGTVLIELSSRQAGFTLSVTVPASPPIAVAHQLSLAALEDAPQLGLELRQRLDHHVVGLRERAVQELECRAPRPRRSRLPGQSRAAPAPAESTRSSAPRLGSPLRQQREQAAQRGSVVRVGLDVVLDRYEIDSRCVQAVDRVVQAARPAAEPAEPARPAACRCRRDCRAAGSRSSRSPAAGPASSKISLSAHPRARGDLLDPRALLGDGEAGPPLFGAGHVHVSGHTRCVVQGRIQNNRCSSGPGAAGNIAA